MRLLETRLPEPGEYPFRLKYVHNPEQIKYAIVSHTWEDDEVLYEDVAIRICEEKAGFAKIQGALQKARNDGHGYLWVDSICIDKSSSSELQEAINSMYAWYEKAEVCYAYLADFEETELNSTTYQSFAASRWFTRGWTLQELIAPKIVKFFYGDWLLLGDKNDLLDPLCTITRISREVLSDADRVQSTCIAQRMSWAARRETTRGEDTAYSLMGLFGVNMPMLYGEGAVSAFIRLQEEIMRRSDDHSLFAWQGDTLPDDQLQLHGLLADCPDAFDFDGVEQIRRDPYKASQEPYTMTNRGLQISLPMTPLLQERDMLYTALLNCYSVDPLLPTEIVFIRLNPRDNLFARVGCRKLEFRGVFAKRSSDVEAIYVPQTVMETRPKGQQQNMQFFRFAQDLPKCVKSSGPIADCSTGLDAFELKELRLLYDYCLEPHLNETMFAIPCEQDSVPRMSFTLQQHIGSRLATIGFGSYGNHQVGFDVSQSIVDFFGAPLYDYNPIPIGSSIRFNDHVVTAKADSTIRHGVRIYDISLGIVPDNPDLIDSLPSLAPCHCCSVAKKTKSPPGLRRLFSKMLCQTVSTGTGQSTANILKHSPETARRPLWRS